MSTPHPPPMSAVRDPLQLGMPGNRNLPRVKEGHKPQRILPRNAGMREEAVPGAQTCTEPRLHLHVLQSAEEYGHVHTCMHIQCKANTQNHSDTP